MKQEKCVLCFEKIEGFGNNAMPLAEGRCCDLCNITKVIPGRIKALEDYEKTRNEARSEYEKAIKDHKERMFKINEELDDFIASFKDAIIADFIYKYHDEWIKFVKEQYEDYRDEQI